MVPATGGPVRLFSNLLTPGVVRDVLSGKASTWTVSDWWSAVATFPLIDAKTVAVRLLLDHSPLADELVTTVHLRRVADKMEREGVGSFCYYHGCAWGKCPEDGAHDEDDDNDYEAGGSQ